MKLLPHSGLRRPGPSRPLPTLLAALALAAPALAAITPVTGYEILADGSIVDSIRPLRREFVGNLGRPFSRSLLLEDVRRFQELGTVSMVRTAQKPYKKGRKLLYRVEANPAIRSLVLEGVSQLDPAEILARFRSRPGQILDYTRLFADLNTIPALYLERRGIMYVDVTDLKDVRVHDGTVTVRVKEFRMGNLAIQGVTGALADLVRRSFQVKKGELIHRDRLLASLCDIFQLSMVRDLDWYPRFDREAGTVKIVLVITPAGSVQAAGGDSGRAVHSGGGD
jgi:outer membrane protein assembly factor BamA